MSYIPGRLHRALSPAGEPIFKITTDIGTFDDTDIQTLTITRGNSSAQPDISPNTMEFEMNGAPFIPRDSAMSLDLQPAFATKFAYGAMTGSQISARFKGRKAATEVTDSAWHRDTGAEFNSKVTASSWTTVLKTGKRKTQPTVDGNIGSELAYMWRHPSIETLQPVNVAPLAEFDSVFATEPAMTFTELSSKYGTDLGTYFQHERNGSVRILSIGHRHQMMLDRLNVEWPILRSQGLSPAKWSQQIESASVQYTVLRRTTSGGEDTQLWPLPDGVSPVLLEQEEIDILHVKNTSAHENYRYLMNSLTMQSNVGRTELESVTFDLIMLLSSTKPADMHVAAQLLDLEAGDPVYLSGDWPDAVRAPYFANEISEKITPDSWEITLKLFHPRDVLGLFDSEIPAVKPRVWDSAITPWDTATGAWESF